MQRDVIVEEARRQAIGVLQRCATDAGFRASALQKGYPQVWGRDSVIASLGAALSGDADLLATFRASLDTLTAYQSGLGLVPLNVDIATQTVSTENAGAVDANLWYIIGHFYHYTLTRDLAYLKACWPAIRKASLWLRYQDMNECGLLEIPEAGNWMDLLAVRYNTLYDNVLYYAALKSMAHLASLCGEDGEREAELATGVHERLNLLFWIDRCWSPQRFAERLERLKAMRLEWYMLYHNVGTISSRPYYLPYVAFRQYGDYCDALGNLLAILCGVADVERSETILGYFHQVGMSVPFPTKALCPVICPGHLDWREYYLSRNLNLPHQYHNSGIWPFIGGFHVAALVKTGHLEKAEGLLQDLARANQQGCRREWEFNEWLHGQTGNPMGYAYQAWSAGMYLYAYEAVKTDHLPLFEAL